MFTLTCYRARTFLVCYWDFRTTLRRYRDECRGMRCRWVCEVLPWQELSNIWQEMLSRSRCRLAPLRQSARAVCETNLEIMTKTTKTLLTLGIAGLALGTAIDSGLVDVTNASALCVSLPLGAV